jgi:hypothetical protein
VILVETKLHEAAASLSLFQIRFEMKTKITLKQVHLCLPRQIMQSCWHISKDRTDGQNALCTCAGKCHLDTIASTVKKAHG